MTGLAEHFIRSNICLEINNYDYSYDSSEFITCKYYAEMIHLILIWNITLYHSSLWKNIYIMISILCSITNIYIYMCENFCIIFVRSEISTHFTKLRIIKWYNLLMLTSVLLELPQNDLFWQEKNNSISYWIPKWSTGKTWNPSGLLHNWQLTNKFRLLAAFILVMQKAAL